MAKAKEFRDQSIEELEAVHQDLTAALYGLKNERKQTGKLERPHEIKAARKDIARVLTVMREKRGQA